MLRTLATVNIRKVLMYFFQRERDYDYSQGSSLQAFEPTYTGIKPASQGFKLQARGHKLEDPGTRVQAHKLRVRGTSNKDK